MMVLAVSVRAGEPVNMVTVMVDVLADWWRSTPPLAVLLLHGACGMRFADGAGVPLCAVPKFRLPMLAAVIDWPAVTSTPLSLSTPLLASVVMVTAWSVLAGDRKSVV